MKLLGLNVRLDINLKEHVNSTYQKMSFAANIIRYERRLFEILGKTLLFNDRSRATSTQMHLIFPAYYKDEIGKL